MAMVFVLSMLGGPKMLGALGQDLVGLLGNPGLLLEKVAKATTT